MRIWEGKTESGTSYYLKYDNGIWRIYANYAISNRETYIMISVYDAKHFIKQERVNYDNME